MGFGHRRSSIFIGVSCEYCEIFKNTFIEEHPQTAASGFSLTDMLTKKNSKKMHTNLNKDQKENFPVLPRRNLINTSNRRVKSVLV